MNVLGKGSAAILGACVMLGLLGMGVLLGDAAVRVKGYERTVVAKGLSEREYPADVVIWPIRFSELGNDLATVYGALDAGAGKIKMFLNTNGSPPSGITVSPPDVTDKWADRYGSSSRAEFRYTAMQTVTVYSQRGVGAQGDGPSVRAGSLGDRVHG